MQQPPYFQMKVGFSDQTFHDQIFKKEGGWKGQLKDPAMWGRIAARTIGGGGPRIGTPEAEPIWNNEGTVAVYSDRLEYKGDNKQLTVYASTVTNVSRDKVPGAVGAGCIRVDYEGQSIFFYSLAETRFKLVNPRLWLRHSPPRPKLGGLVHPYFQ
jgi:hypothetical protein